MAAAGAIFVANACIPDLPPDRSSAAAVGPGCGDGYIDLAAGEECDPGAVDAASQGCSDQCKVVCSGLRWSGNDHCYELMASAAALQGHCANFGGSGHVVTFASEAEFDAVAAYLSDAGAGAFWVGLWEAPDRFNSVVANEPGWSAACPGCFAHTLDPRLPLGRSPQSLGDASATGCVEGFASRASWLEYPCSGSSPLRVVCEHEPNGVHSRSCEAGVCIDLVATQRAKSYVYEPLPASWVDAESRCRDLGGSLVVLESRDEREQLWFELSKLPSSPTRVWIGLAPSADDAGDDAGTVWTWDDGTNADAPDAHPSPWGIGQPSAPAPAFLDNTPSQAPVDDTLAHTDSTVRALPFVCQIVVPGDD
jgi:hypothetical protein